MRGHGFEPRAPLATPLTRPHALSVGPDSALAPNLLPQPGKRQSSWVASKVVATLGPATTSVETLSALLKSGMSVARIDLTWGSLEFHLRSLANLHEAMRRCHKLCAIQVDTLGREIMVRRTFTEDPSGWPVHNEQLTVSSGETVILTHDPTHADVKQEAASKGPARVLPITSDALCSLVQPGDTVYVGRYLASGAPEQGSLFLRCVKVTPQCLVCTALNAADLGGLLTVFHIERSEHGLSNKQSDLPVLSQFDKDCLAVITSHFEIDFLGLSFTRNATDVYEAMAFLRTIGSPDTAVVGKIETRQALFNFQEILDSASSVLISRGLLGLDVPVEKMVLVQKALVVACNLAGKPVIVSRVLDSMSDSPRPTRAEATDVANIILDGADGVLLGAETLRGKYPVEAVRMAVDISRQAECVFDHTSFYEFLMDSAMAEEDSTDMLPEGVMWHVHSHPDVTHAHSHPDITHPSNSHGALRGPYEDTYGHTTTGGAGMGSGGGHAGRGTGQADASLGPNTPVPSQLTRMFRGGKGGAGHGGRDSPTSVITIASHVPNPPTHTLTPHTAGTHTYSFKHHPSYASPRESTSPRQILEALRAAKHPLLNGLPAQHNDNRTRTNASGSGGGGVARSDHGNSNNTDDLRSPPQTRVEPGSGHDRMIRAPQPNPSPFAAQAAAAGSLSPRAAASAIAIGAPGVTVTGPGSQRAAAGLADSIANEIYHGRIAPAPARGASAVPQRTSIAVPPIPPMPDYHTHTNTLSTLPTVPDADELQDSGSLQDLGMSLDVPTASDTQGVEGTPLCQTHTGAESDIQAGEPPSTAATMGTAALEHKPSGVESEGVDHVGNVGGGGMGGVGVSYAELERAVESILRARGLLPLVHGEDGTGVGVEGGQQHMGHHGSTGQHVHGMQHGNRYQHHGDSHPDMTGMSGDSSSGTLRSGARGGTARSGGRKPMSKLESITSSAVRAAEKVKASLIVVLTHCAGAPQLVAKYRPPMPILTLVIPQLVSDGLKWRLQGRSHARQCLLSRGLLPMLSAPGPSGDEVLEESVATAARWGLVSAHQYVVVVERIHENYGVKVVAVDELGHGIKHTPTSPLIGTQGLTHTHIHTGGSSGGRRTPSRRDSPMALGASPFSTVRHWAPSTPMVGRTLSMMEGTPSMNNTLHTHNSLVYGPSTQGSPTAHAAHLTTHPFSTSSSSVKQPSGHWMAMGTAAGQAGGFTGGGASQASAGADAYARRSVSAGSAGGSYMAAAQAVAMGLACDRTGSSSDGTVTTRLTVPYRSLNTPDSNDTHMGPLVPSASDAYPLLLGTTGQEYDRSYSRSGSLLRASFDEEGPYAHTYTSHPPLTLTVPGVQRADSNTRPTHPAHTLLPPLQEQPESNTQPGAGNTSSAHTSARTSVESARSDGGVRGGSQRDGGGGGEGGEGEPGHRLPGASRPGGFGSVTNLQSPDRLLGRGGSGALATQGSGGGGGGGIMTRQDSGVVTSTTHTTDTNSNINTPITGAQGVVNPTRQLSAAAAPTFAAMAAAAAAAQLQLQQPAAAAPAATPPPIPHPPKPIRVTVTVPDTPTEPEDTLTQPVSADQGELSFAGAHDQGMGVGMGEDMGEGESVGWGGGSSFTLALGPELWPAGPVGLAAAEPPQLNKVLAGAAPAGVLCDEEALEGAAMQQAAASATASTGELSRHPSLNDLLDGSLASPTHPANTHTTTDPTAPTTLHTRPFAYPHTDTDVPSLGDTNNPTETHMGGGGTGESGLGVSHSVGRYRRLSIPHSELSRLSTEGQDIYEDAHSGDLGGGNGSASEFSQDEDGYASARGTPIRAPAERRASFSGGPLSVPQAVGAFPTGAAGGMGDIYNSEASTMPVLGGMAVGAGFPTGIGVGDYNEPSTTMPVRTIPVGTMPVVGMGASALAQRSASESTTDVDEPVVMSRSPAHESGELERAARED